MSYFLTDTVAIGLTPVGAGIRPFIIRIWPSTSNAPAPKCNGYLRIVIPERKAKMPVQAINVRCLKCGYRLAWVLVEETAAELCAAVFRFTQRLCDFFLAGFQSTYPGVQEILHKEEKGIAYWKPVLSRLVSGFIHHSKGMRERLVDGVGSSKANKQILSDYSRMEIQDGRVLPNGLLRGIVYIPLMKDGEVISLRWTAVENGDLLRFRFQK